MATADSIFKTCAKCGVDKPHSMFSQRKGVGDGLRAQCRTCCAKVAAAWCAANPGNTKASHDKYRAANYDTVIARQRAYAAANKDRKKITDAEWEKANQERRQLTKSKWRAVNQDRVKLGCAAWWEANPEKKRIYAQNYRALKKAGGVLTTGLADKLFKLQKGKCACCKQPLGDDYHLDHVVPLALGGSNTDDNMQLLRARCNKQKGAKDPLLFMQSRGFLL